jgi:hypothetical protein
VARYERSSCAVTNRLLRWERITDRQSATPLQGFTCTTDRPRSLAGKKLPHPKPWEWEVQSHLRQSSVRLKNGELLLVGRSADTAIAAAAHLIFTPLSTGTETFIAAVAVSTNFRGQGGAIADEALVVICEVACERAASDGGELALVTGKIHNQNQPSEALCVRSGFEPYLVPQGDYQPWVLRLPLTTS